MEITAEPRESFTILHLRGEFDTFYCPLLQQEIDALVGAGVHHVALNLRLVKFINSTALGAIIKASKTLKSHEGGLAISRPSAFCKDIIEKVGLDRVVPVHATDEEAGAALVANVAESSDASEDVLEDETAILFAPTDGDRIAHYVEQSAGTANPLHGHTFGENWRGVGRMSHLDEGGMRFTWNGGSTGLSPFEMGQLLSLGTDLSVKFRLPLLQKGHCDAVVTIDEVEERPDGVKLGAIFKELDTATADAVKQYAADLEFLKTELRSATKDAD